MGDLADLIAQTPVAAYMRVSRWGYAAVNTGHVLGLGLLIGSIAALDLRLIGFWKSEPLAPLARILPRIAMAGLVLAIVTGFLLFSARPADYAANSVFLTKLVLVLLGALIALWAHWAGLLTRGSPAALRALGAASLICWTLALICGRLIAFTGE